MALSLEVGKETIEVISSRDPSVKCEGDAYSNYLDSLDENLLQIADGTEPTRFVMRKILPFGVTQRLKTEQGALDENGRMQIRMGYILDEVRAALIDVKNPGSPSLHYKKDSDGFASKELITLLESAGITNELFAARQAAMRGTGASKKG